MDPLASRLHTFLRKCITVEKPSGPVVRFELKHIPVGKSGGQEVLVIEPDRACDDDWFNATVGEIQSAAEADAHGLGGVQRYVLLSYREKKKTKIDARCTFRIEGEPLETDEMDSEPPTSSGMMAQLMRHNQGLAKLIVANTTSATQLMSRALARVSEQNEKLLQQRFETIELVEELFSHRQERQLELQKAESRQRFMEEGIKQARLLGPAIVNRLAKKEVIPESEQNNPRTIAIQSFAESLTDEQKMKIAETLDQTQTIALLEIFQSAQRRTNDTSD